jgi:acyl transferase domain-containing protein
VGDPVEMAAITKVYSKDRQEPLIVASGKTNIGHTESCSGFAGIIKVILAMQNDIIPPHINLETINPHIKLEAIPAIVPREPLKWTKGANGMPRLVGVSSFGITGTDAHIILQEPPKYTPKKLVVESKDRPLHVITLSSKSETGLEQVLQKYTEFLEANPKLELSDVAYSANTGRAHFPYRVAFVGKDLTEVTKKVKGAMGSLAVKHIPEEKPKICFLFTGESNSRYD